jgi:hypothetical protein
VLAPLLDIKQRAAAALAELPEQYKALTNAPEYPVERSAALVQLRERAMAAYAAAGAQRES